MDILETLKNRRSCRKYKAEQISKDELIKIIEAGEFAASGMGRQSPIIVSVTDKQTRDQLSALNAEAMGKSAAEVDPFYGAPQLLIVLADKTIPTYIYDGSLVMGNMMNEAASLGIGSCWIHRAKQTFESDIGKALLEKWGIKGDYEGIGNLIIGYPDGDTPIAKPRKDNFVYFA
ncbi:MAG: nitroreductase [Treponema sp.]|nr:nitroreductase [Treponema sp.]